MIAETIKWDDNFTWTEDHFTEIEENTTLDDSYSIPEGLAISTIIPGGKLLRPSIQ